MWQYAARRLAHTIIVIFGVTILLFGLFYVIPGDPIRVLTGNRHLTPAELASLRQNLHLDQPIYIQYFYYLERLLAGDLGVSYRYQRPVTAVLRDFYPNSIRLAMAAVALEAIIGIGAGIMAALKKNTFVDSLVLVSSSLLISLPVFWLGMLLQIVFGVKLRWLPISGIGDGGIRNYILPAITLAAVSAAFVAQTMRAGMVKALNENHIRTARAGGLSNSKIVGKYALKNALAPVITLLGLDLGALMGGAVATEVVFNWPGIGNQIYLAILARDRPLVMGAVLTLVLIFIGINLLADFSYLFFDPRIRTGERVTGNG